MKVTLQLFCVSLPILIMIGIIPLVTNDYILTLIYIAIITALFMYKKEKKIDMIIFAFGFCVMILFEYIFISTGVETFIRNSLFGVMPLWLPFLWGYGFVAIKTGIKILESK